LRGSVGYTGALLTELKDRQGSFTHTDTGKTDKFANTDRICKASGSLALQEASYRLSRETMTPVDRASWAGRKYKYLRGNARQNKLQIVWQGKQDSSEIGRTEKYLYMLPKVV
jgi:hypothetical protein